MQQNYAEAARWYREAANQGIAIAQYYLGGMYFFGQGVKQDYAEALTWYRNAAEQGNLDAQKAVALMYYYGQGVPKDPVQAYMWFDITHPSGAARRWRACCRGSLAFAHGRGPPSF